MNNENILKKYLELVRMNHLIQKQRVCEKTITAYRHCLGLFFKHIGDKPLRRVKTFEIKEYLAECASNGIKAATLKNRLTAIKAMYKELSDPDHNLKLHDVASCIKPIRGSTSNKNPIDKTDLQTIAKHFRVLRKKDDLTMRNYLFFEMLRFYGLRMSSVLGLEVSDIAFEANGVRVSYVGKGNKKSSKLMPYKDSEGQSIRQVLLFKISLQRLIKKIESGPIFLTFLGNQMSYSGALKIFHENLEECGMHEKGYTPHSIRHSFVSHKLAAGVPLQTVSMLADHANTQITASIYSKGEDSDSDSGMTSGLI